MGKREDNRDEKRRLIVETARQLMQAREASDFSMRTLAEVAGVSSATPYSLFGSKQAIIAAVMDTDFDDFQAALATDAPISNGAMTSDTISTETGPVFATFFRLVDVTVDLFAANPGYYRTGALAIQTASDKTLTSHFGLPRHGLLKDLIRDAIQRGDISHRVNADSFALNLGHQFYGWIQAWARGDIDLTALANRAKYSIGMGLLAVAAEDKRLPLLAAVMNIQDQLPEAGTLAAILETKTQPDKQEAVG